MRSPWPVIALAVGAFGIGATEFSPMGLLPLIAGGLGVSIPAAGLLISVYALGVTLGGPLMTLVLARWSQKWALIILMGLFTLGNLLAAVAPGYDVLVIARLITSLAHGAFFGIGSVVAARLARPGQSARAVAGMFMGLALANIGGVPAASWIGQEIGWRSAFAIISALGGAAIAVLLLALPAGEPCGAPDIRKEIRVLVQPAVLLALATTMTAAAAMFTFYTYVAPILAEVSAASPGFISGGLVMIGIGFTLGNKIGAQVSDRGLSIGLALFLAVAIITNLLFPVIGRTLPGAAIALLIWGAAAFAVVPPLQAQVMRAAADAPGLAAAVNVGAFNLGNALGAALGGAIIATGTGYASVPFGGAAMAGVALLLVVIPAWRGIPRTRPRGVAPQ